MNLTAAADAHAIPAMLGLETVVVRYQTNAVVRVEAQALDLPSPIRPEPVSGPLLTSIANP